MVPSPPPEASRPPGSTARAFTEAEWPSRVAWSWPLAGSQSLMVPSPAPKASRPSGSTARALTVLPSPLIVRSRASSARRLAVRGRGPPAFWSWSMACSRRLVAAAPVGPPGGSVGQRARSWEGSCSGWAASTWEALRSTRRKRCSAAAAEAWSNSLSRAAMPVALSLACSQLRSSSRPSSWLWRPAASR